MRTGGLLMLICALALVGGCGKKAAPVVKAPPPLVNPHKEWPADTLPKPEFVGVVDRTAGRVAGDAEPTRIPSTYQLPDWSIATSTISAKGPKGSKIVFHFLPRTEPLKHDDDLHITRLLKGKPRAAEKLVVARPWIGWYGQGSGLQALPDNKQRPYALRVYNLFDGDRQLEVHVEWPAGDKEAYEEGQSLLAHVVYSVKALP